MGYDIGHYWASTATYTQGNDGRDWIVVHYTATNASALNNCIYFSGGDRGASAHYFVDSESIWQSVPEEDSAWHAGNWAINSTSIGIEVVSAGQDFTDGEIDRLAWLVSDLMNRYGIDANHVIRHYDVADVAPWGGTLDPHKLCPRPYIDAGKWNWLHDRITSGQQEDEVRDEDIDKIVNRICDRLPDLCADATNWRHYNIDGVDGYTLLGLIKNLPRDVWEYILAGTSAGNRLVGDDLASNNVNNVMPIYADAILDAIEKVAKNGGVDISGIAEDCRKAVKEELEKIELNVTVKE